MALLEMGANVQNNGYFPGYYSTRDLIFNSEGSTWTSSNVNGEPKNDHHVGSLPVSSPSQLLGYNKELLKQTILKQEAIFRDQIQELHRVYQKQRELMDEIKRNELYKHNLRLKASWSCSSLPSKNADKIFCSPNLPWSTGQSSILIAESNQLTLASMEEMSRQICHPPAHAPTVTEGASKDPELLESKYRKVGKKILDLQLPADEYIDSEGESWENERVTKVPQPQVSAYSVNGISQVVYSGAEKPYGTSSNVFADLNVPFKLEEEAAAKSNCLGGPPHHRNNSFHDLSGRTKLGCHNLPSDVIQNLSKRLDLVACSDVPLPDQKKKHEWLSSGQSDGVLDSFAKVIDIEKQSVSVGSLSMNLKQVNYPPCFHSLHQINQEPLTEKIFSSGEVSAGTQCPTGNGLLGPSGASCTPVLYQLVSGASGISPIELWKTPLSDVGQSQMEVRALPCFSSSGSLGQTSKSLMRMSGFTRDVLHQGKSVKSGPNLDSQNIFLSSSFCSRSKLFDLPSVGTNDANSCDNHGSSASHEVRNYVEGSEDVGTPKNINLNIMPAGSSDTTAFQCIQITAKETKFQGSGRGLPWLKEKPAPKEKSDEKGEDQSIEEIEKGCCISNVNSPHNHVPDLGEQIPSGEHLMKNEQKKHEPLAGIIDLNSCVNEDENMSMDVDFQAPASPENKECSPPRGESDENQLEMPCELTGQEEPEVQEEQVRIAAESLVSISEYVPHNVLQMTTCSSSEPSVVNPLHWFAGIVSTMGDHPQNVVKVDFSGKANDFEEFLPANMDYFEFMTLNLTETKVLDCCCKSSGQTEQEGGSSSSPTQPRKGRTNRGRWRKDFQSDILPSLASLSRYEVTEDLQTIGGLVEAAGTHSETGSLRSAGRTALARGRKRSGTSASNMVELLLKQLTQNSELGTEKRGLLSWGKICKKRRGQRFPTRNPKFLLSEVYN